MCVSVDICELRILCDTPEKSTQIIRKSKPSVQCVDDDGDVRIL